MHACMASGRTDPACCSSLSFQNARIKSIFSSKASAASSASAMATGHKDLHRPTHTNGHVAQYGGDQDAMDEKCDDGDNQSRARRRRGRWQRRRESPRWSKSRAALFSLANGQVTATVTAGFLRESNCHAVSHPLLPSSRTSRLKSMVNGSVTNRRITHSNLARKSRSSCKGTCGLFLFARVWMWTDGICTY